MTSAFVTLRMYFKPWSMFQILETSLGGVEVAMQQQTLTPTAVVVVMPLLLPLTIPLLTAPEKPPLLMQAVRDDYTKYIQSDRSNTYAHHTIVAFFSVCKS